MKNDDPDLTFVDPHKRELVAERIAAVKRFNRNPGRVNAEKEAKALGLSAGRFYLIVKAWNTQRDASTLPGSNRHRMSARVPKPVRELIENLLRKDPDIIPERVIEAVVQSAKASGITAPSGPTIADEVNRQRRGRLPAWIEQNVNFAVDHCHLTIPVMLEGEVSSVTLSGVIDVARGIIIGVALTEKGPDLSSTARAIAHAAKVGRIDCASAILIDNPGVGEWLKLITAIEKAGLTVVGETFAPDEFDHDRGVLRKRGNGRLLRAVAGRYISGFTMRVRTRGSKSKPPTQGKAGAAPFTMEQAEHLVRSRITADIPECNTPDGLAGLATELERLRRS